MDHKENLEKINQSIQQGELLIAKALIKKIKVRSLDPIDLINLADLYLRLSNPTMAIKVLGPECGDLAFLSDAEVIKESMRAYLYHYVGARFVAKKIFSKVELEFAKRKLDIARYFKKYYRYRAYVYQSGHDFKNSYHFFLQALEHEVEGSYNYKFLLIGLAESLDGMGKFNQAKEMIKKVLSITSESEVLLKAICLSSLGEYNRHQENFVEAQDYFEQSLRVFASISGINTKDLGYLYKEWGALDVQLKNFESAKVKLDKAYEIFSHAGAQPISAQETMYWRIQIPSLELSINQKILAYAHPNYNAYSFALGKGRSSRDLVDLPHWFDHKKVNQLNNCWEITNNEIRAIDYIDESSPTDSYLDLYSGIIKNRDHFEILTEMEVRCLSAIIGSGDLGMHLWSLLDFIYKIEFLDVDSGFDRMKKLIDSLIKKSFPITRKENIFKIDLTKLPTKIFIPMNHQSSGVFIYLQKNHSHFTRSELEELFQIKKSTASKWIKNWQEQGLISVKQTGQNISYHLIEDVEEAA